MAFAKGRESQVNNAGLEEVADVFTLTNGTQVSSTAKAAAIAALTVVSTPDGSDATTTQTLANALKVKVNAIIAALQA